MSESDDEITRAVRRMEGTRAPSSPDEKHIHHEHFIDDARGKQRAFDDPRELRAFALNKAVESREWFRDSKDDADTVTLLIERAKKFEAYLTGNTNGE